VAAWAAQLRLQTVRNSVVSCLVDHHVYAIDILIQPQGAGFIV